MVFNKATFVTGLMPQNVDESNSWTLILIAICCSSHYSPSGNVLRTVGEIKDYLLSAGTCKCGLPCPFRPELFFNFDSQVS